MASASASSLRLFRTFALALGFAVVLAAAPGAIVVPADGAPVALTAPAEIAQEPIDPSGDTIDVPRIEDEEEEEEDEESAPPDTLARPLLVKPDSSAVDSLRTGKGNFLPTGGAQAETLGFKAPGVGPSSAKGVGAAKPKERRTPFGIHPAAFFVVLLAGHIFLVGAVSD